jgi:hypothetical protein
MNDNIKQLQQELHAELRQAARNRKIIRISRLFCYGGALLYFVGLIGAQAFLFSGGDASFFYTLNPNPTFFEQYKLLIFVAPLFFFFFIGGYGVSFYCL